MALREPTLFILGALASGRLHGYGIIAVVEKMSDGRVSLSAGTLYGALDRLEKDGHVTRAGEESAGGPVRRYYELTKSGKSLLRDEADRLESTTRAVQAAMKQAWA